MFSNTVFLIKSKGSFLEKYIEILTEFKMVMKETKSLGFQTPCEEVLGPPQSIFFKWFLFNLLLGFNWVPFLSAYDITWKVDGAIPMYWFIMAPLLSHLLGVASHLLSLWCNSRKNCAKICLWVEIPSTFLKHFGLGDGQDPRRYIITWNLKQPFINGCFNWMIFTWEMVV